MVEPLLRCKLYQLVKCLWSLLKTNGSSKFRGGRDDEAKGFGDENAKDGDQKANDIDDNSKTEELKWRPKMSTVLKAIDGRKNRQQV
jgi:hypothetical protein